MRILSFPRRIWGGCHEVTGGVLQLLLSHCVCPIENKRSNFMSTPYKQLTRSSTHRVFTGLCGGLGEYFNIDPTIVRLLFVLGFFAGLHFAIVIAYVIMALIIPEGPAKI